MKKFAVIILAITLLFAFSIPALAQNAIPVAPAGDNPMQGQGLEKWGHGLPPGQGGLPPGQGGLPPGQGGFKTFPVPEPMTAVLLLAGLLGVAGVLRRIKKD